jgi:hypothetical protein
MLVTSKKVNDAARKVLHQNFPKRTLIIIDGKGLAENIVKHSLLESILQIKGTPSTLERKN